MSITNTLIELTKGKVSGNIDQLLDFVVDGKYTPFQELTKDCDNFHFYGKELLIYKDNKIFYSANVIEYCSQHFITTMYNNEGLVYNSSFDYETEENHCLYDLYDLKKHNPKTWMYKLVELYDQYGVDTMNTARWLFGY